METRQRGPHAPFRNGRAAFTRPIQRPKEALKYSPLLTFPIFIVVVLAMGMCGTSRAQETQSAPQTLQPYTVALEGVDAIDPAIGQQIRDVSLSLQLQETPPPTLAGLRRRADQDVTRFLDALQSHGYYDATVEADIRPPAEGGGPAALVFGIEPGAVYVLGEVSIVRADIPQGAVADAVLLDYLNLVPGAPATAAAIIDAEGLLARQYRIYAFPFAAVPSRRTVIDRDMKRMTVQYTVQTGVPAVFGAIRVEGLRDVGEEFVLAHVPWTYGAAYNIQLIEEYQRKLARTGLFDSVTVAPVRSAASGQGGGPVQAIPILVTLLERDHRSIGFGATYSTEEGPGAHAYWEHRNLFGAGENLRFATEASDVERALTGTFKKPVFQRIDQALVAEGSIKDVTTDAFDETRVSSFIGVERKLTQSWSVTAGPTLELISQDTEQTGQDDLILAGFRTGLKFDNTDNFLDPTRGSRLQIDVSPFHDFGGFNETFLSSSLHTSHYLSVDDDGDFVLAGRTRLGTIVGAERADVPAANLFFAGGGGSVRAFGFQRLGPLDAELDPLGGRSVVEVGMEFRARITENFGIVPFIEGGNVYEEEIPSLSELDLQWGAGLGFRYYTAIGPVRLDIAVPIDKRENIDDDYQFYVSLGQAF